MSTGDGWSISTDITTDTELSAYSNSLKIYIDTYTSDSELKDYSNSAAATYATNELLVATINKFDSYMPTTEIAATYYNKDEINRTLNNYITSTAFNTYSTSAAATYATQDSLSAVDTKLTTFSTSAAATYVTSDKLQVFSEAADITNLKESTFTNTIANYYTNTESDGNLESYSNQVSIALQNLNGNFNNYYDKTHFDLVIEAYSNNAELVYLTKADATNTYATIINLNAVDTKLTTFSTSAAATYATQDSLSVVDTKLTTFSNSADTTFYKAADFTTYSTSAAATYATKSELTAVDDKFDDYYTSNQIDNTLTNYLKLSYASATYATQSSLTTVDNKFSNYYTKTESDGNLESYSNQVSIALKQYYTSSQVDSTLASYLKSSDASATYATQSELTTVDNKFSNYYTSSQIDNTLANYSTSSEIADYYYNKSQINTSVAACVQTTDYNSDLTNKIYTTTGLTSPSILTYQNGKSTLNLPTTNGNYILNNSNNTYSFTEYIGNDYIHYNITYPSTATFSLLSTDQDYLTFTPGYSCNYLIVGTIDNYIDDITLLTPPEDSTLMDYEWIDALPIINISVGGVLTFQYVVKQNQPLQTIPINIVYFASNSNTTTSLSINCQVTSNTEGPTLQPSNIFVRPSKYNNNLRIVKM